MQAQTIMIKQFQSTLLHEERLHTASRFLAIIHFNPRSYMRSDSPATIVVAVSTSISIHAPT